MGALAVDGWAVTFGTARRGLVGAAAGPRPHRRTKCNSPPVNGHCTNTQYCCIMVRWSAILMCP